MPSASHRCVAVIFILLSGFELLEVLLLRNRFLRKARKEFAVSGTAMLGMGMPASAIALATASVSTGAASSLLLVISSTKPHSFASCAVSQPPTFMRASNSSQFFLHLPAYIEAMLPSSLSRSFFICLHCAMSASRSSALRLSHLKNSAEHLCTRYIALQSIVTCFAPSEAMVAADAFIPT